MFEIVRRLVKKGRTKDAGNAEFVRKSTYETWDCIKCGQSFFYKILRCPSCESSIVKQITHSTPKLKDFQYGHMIVNNAVIFKTRGVLQWRCQDAAVKR